MQKEKVWGDNTQTAGLEQAHTVSMVIDLVGEQWQTASDNFIE